MSSQVLKTTLLFICVLGIAGSYSSKDTALLNGLNKLLDNTVLKRITTVLRAGSVTCLDDKAVSVLCPLWKKAGACKYQRVWMRRYCAKTCDLCTPPAPPPPKVPDCAKTTFGCCWDNATVAKGPVEDLIASQCPPCMDRQSHTFCDYWKKDCHNQIPGQGNVMRHRCPTTCKVPCDNNLNMHKTKCQDDPAFKQHCLVWFDEGKCRTDQEQMRLFCPFSCAFCQVDVAGYNLS